MHLSTLDILRCPYCGGRLELVESLFHRRAGDEIRDGILGCHCCIFGVVDGIPVMHLEGSSAAARAHIEEGRPDLARRLMLNLHDDDRARRFDELAASDTATFKEVVDVLDPSAEGGYFFYRFSDPSYIVAQALVRAVAGTALRGGGRAIDICGGAGHLTRSLLDLSSPPPVLADLYFSKLWLGKRFVTPECEAVCCDANGPLPFGRGAFRFAMCADAFMFIWTKRQLIQEMVRLIDHGSSDAPGAVMIGHAHNAHVWSPSHGNALSPAAYGELFETLPARLFAEAGLFDDVVKRGVLDLSRRDSPDVLDADPAVAVVAARGALAAEVFTAHRVEDRRAVQGEWRVNPLYAVSREGDRVRLTLRFPSEDYADEFAASREYLPDELELAGASLAALADGRIPPDLQDAARRRVILDLPPRYY